MIGFPFGNQGKDDTQSAGLTVLVVVAGGVTVGAGFVTQGIELSTGGLSLFFHISFEALTIYISKINF